MTDLLLLEQTTRPISFVHVFSTILKLNKTLVSILTLPPSTYLRNAPYYEFRACSREYSACFFAAGCQQTFAPFYSGREVFFFYSTYFVRLFFLSLNWSFKLVVYSRFSLAIIKVSCL